MHQNARPVDSDIKTNCFSNKFAYKFMYLVLIVDDSWNPSKLQSTVRETVGGFLVSQ